MALRPRKKSKRQAKYIRCKRCGGQVRRAMGRCKKCNQSH
ncbi:hypothetical protein ElP_04770 [Tautonia plasticadhaerens]|uniref:50S ribosomal protein L40e n=1 Tax=Tautonia plasticadhaerens TaxID=2527974 RepID=A0A518GVL4_9BACT|nr:hypothetical protein ElP_04770 [Tautonia plasticadhaerens]